MNNDERSQWIDNDEGLYRWWQSERCSKRDFIRAHKHEIDQIIEKMTSGERRQHFLIYG